VNDPLIKKILDEFSESAPMLIEDREKLLENIEFVRTLKDDLKIKYVKENSFDLINRDLTEVPDKVILKVIRKYIDIFDLIKLETEIIKSCYDAIDFVDDEKKRINIFINEYSKYTSFKMYTYPLLYDGILNHKN
jgi:hypothetical protein